MRGARRFWLSVLVLTTVAGTGCGSSLQRRSSSERATREPSAKVGKALLATATAPGPTITDTPLFVVTLEDQNHLHPAGIPVRVSGPDARTLLSDERGTVSFSGPAGEYQVDVMRGCHERVVVTGGSSTRVHTVRGAQATGTLRVVWQHRIGPSPPAYANVSGGWPVGEEVEVTFTATDRCDENPVPGGMYPTFAFETSSNLRVVGRPRLQADGEGRGRVRLMCTQAGDIGLVSVDRTNPADRTDFAAALTDYSGPPHCID